MLLRYLQMIRRFPYSIRRANAYQEYCGDTISSSSSRTWCGIQRDQGLDHKNSFRLADARRLDSGSRPEWRRRKSLAPKQTSKSNPAIGVLIQDDAEGVGTIAPTTRRGKMVSKLRAGKTPSKPHGPSNPLMHLSRKIAGASMHAW